MIQSAIQLFRALRRPEGAKRNPSELAAQLEQLAQRNAELEQAVLTHQKIADGLCRTQADLIHAQRLTKIANWRWSVPRNELIEISDTFAEIYGVDTSEIYALMQHRMERVLHPEDHERVQSAFREVKESGNSYEIEYRIVHSNGEIRHIHEIGECIFDDSSQVIEQVGTVQDVTELKQAEAALQQAHDELEQRIWVRTAQLQNANAALREEATERKHAEAKREEWELLIQSAARASKIGYALWDELERKYLSVSEEYAHLFGLTVEEFEERYPTFAEDREAIHPEDRERYHTLEDAYRENPVDTPIEYRIITPTGETLHVRELMQPIRDETGRLIQSIITIQDLTEQKQTEEQLRQAQKMEAVGQLTGGIAHDFNNLLAVILGNLELLEGEIDKTTQASEWVQTAIAATERGAGLTQRLLAFSRKQALQPESLDTNVLIQGMLDLLRLTIGESIEIELVQDAGLWQSRADLNQLENAILNLVINARDAMPAGGKLTITTSNTRISDDYALAQAGVAPGPYVLVTVTDTGSGMPKAVRQHAFEPFYTTKDAGRGSGLGLSMVYGFIKQSGGHVSIYSEVGVGTTVRLYLPKFSGKEAPEAAAINSSEIPKAIDSSEIPKANGEVVLVVEDDQGLRSLVVRILRSLDYKVLEVNSAAPALEVLRSPAEVDLLLTDLVLPEKMSGNKLVEEALLVRPDLRVLYMSGYTEDAILHQGRLADGVEFLQKPFRTVDVARAVQKALAAPKV